jgi:outer membrane protein OmpA-like peptidoglycan-associated protein
MAKPRKTAFLDAATRGTLQLQRWTPITGIGRFDARLDVAGHMLTITVRCFFTWVAPVGQPPWTGAEQNDYKAAAKKILEETWSQCYTLAVDKDGWRDVYAGVDVKVEAVNDSGSSHYTIQVTKVTKGETFRSGIIRSEWKGNFSQWDIYPEDKKGRDQQAASFASKQVESKLESTRTQYIAFDANSSKIPQQGAVALNALATNLRTIFTKELSDSGYRIYCYGKTARTETGISNLTTGKNRAKAVAEFLNQKFSYPVATVVDSFEKESWMKADLDKILAAANVPPADRPNRSFQGCVLVTKDQGLAGSASVGIVRNYIVIAHEFGHMLGLPDEYFGVNCMELQQQIDLLSTVPQSLQNLTRLKAKPDADYVESAQGFASLLKQGNVPSPVFMQNVGVVTTSLMYAGSHVLPAHYLTFWEAMLTMCYPYIWPGELKIVPNPAGSAKRSNIEFFAS